MLTDTHYKLLRSRNTYDLKNNLGILECRIDEVMHHLHSDDFAEEYRSKVSNNPKDRAANEDALDLMRKERCEMFVLSALFTRDTGQPRRTDAYNLLGCEKYTEFFILWKTYSRKLKGKKAPIFTEASERYHTSGHAKAEEYLMAMAKRDAAIDEYRRRIAEIAKEILEIQEDHEPAKHALFFQGDMYDPKYSSKTLKFHKQIYSDIARMKEALK